MTTMRFNWNWAFGAFVAFFGLVLILAYHGLIPREIKVIPLYDLIGHFILFGILTLLFFKFLETNFIHLTKQQMLSIVGGVVSVFAISEEFLQVMSSNRTFDLLDLLMSLLGVLIALFITRKFQTLYALRNAIKFEKYMTRRHGVLAAYLFGILLWYIGIRFTLPILNDVAAIILLTSFWYFAYFIFTIHTKSLTLNILKAGVGTLFGLVALGSLLFSLFIGFHIYWLATDWYGKDLSNEEIHRTKMTNFVDVVVYRTNGGATTDYGVNIYKEIGLGLGLKKTNSAGGVYHAYDIEVERVDDNSTRIKHIEFTLGHGSDYYGTLRDGQIIGI